MKYKTVCYAAIDEYMWEAVYCGESHLILRPPVKLGYPQWTVKGFNYSDVDRIIVKEELV